jgi:hypothetical protein
MTSSPTIEREPEVAELHRPPPIIHLFGVKWWETWLPPRFWRIRQGDVALCGRRCNWTSPRGHHLRVKGEVCVVCRDLSQSKP